MTKNPKDADTNIKQTKNEEIEAFLREHYNFRFNTVKSRAEYCLIGEGTFHIINKIFINSICRKLDHEANILTSFYNINSILESDFLKNVNPIQEYFRHLPQKEGVDAITRLASTVVVKNSGHWLEYLTKWLVGVIANALNNEGCQNHVCLVLTGDQGLFKTTWLDHLCPDSLKSYRYTGKVDPQNKDVLTLLAECLFINIDDQLKFLNKRNENDLKNMITTPSVKYRRPYDVYIEEYPHIASFMASVNGNDFLTDPTGSRRFLPFEVLYIDISVTKGIKMDDVYSEAMFMYVNNFRYWFKDSEIYELHRQSSAFYVQTIEFEILMDYFEQPDENELDYYFMTTAHIINYLSERVSLRLSNKKMGESLKKSGYIRKSKRVNGMPVYGWFIKPIESK